MEDYFIYSILMCLEIGVWLEMDTSATWPMGSKGEGNIWATFISEIEHFHLVSTFCFFVFCLYQDARGQSTPQQHFIMVETTGK